VIKPQNRADGLVVWENVGPDDECEWSHGRAGEAWFQLSESAVVQIEGALDPAMPPMKIEKMIGGANWTQCPVPQLVRPKVISPGTATILMQR
jgi:hypothetical protein